MESSGQGETFTKLSQMLGGRGSNGGDFKDVWVLRMYFLLWHFLRRLKKRNPQILRSFFHYFLAAKLQFFDCNTRLSLDHVRLWGLFSFNNLTECSKMKTLIISEKTLTLSTIPFMKILSFWMRRNL